MELKFTKENFKQEVLKSNLLVVIDFYADWCQPCQMIAPIIEGLAEEYNGTVKIGKLNVDEQEELAAKYQVMSIPTIIFFKNGAVLETIMGQTSKDVLKKTIDTYK